MIAAKVGHEDWVQSVAWQPPVASGPDEDGSIEQALCVLSASMDRTMMLWRPDPSVGALPTETPTFCVRMPGINTCKQRVAQGTRQEHLAQQASASLAACSGRSHLA